MAATIRILQLRSKRQPVNFVPVSSFSISNTEEIRKKLADFRTRSAPRAPPRTDGDQPPSPPSFPSKNISFHELYKRNAQSRPDAATPPTRQPSFDSIYDGIHQNLKNNPVPFGKKNDPNHKDSLKWKLSNLIPKELPKGIDSDKLPIFGKEIKDLKDGDNKASVRKRFLRQYTHQELGERLRSLRPEHKGKMLFSLQELNDRLLKLRDIDENEFNSGDGGLRTQLMGFLRSMEPPNENSSNKGFQRIWSSDMFTHPEENTDYLLHPPKQHLVEKFLDPCNMSSAEKMKLELKKVRDDFKMSESDCGSARVQVAQLTTKIKHLSGVLHKKDKHSRKGLQAMVQKRKKLLKYLRRTDWDSYCLVLSKFSLRDNPDYKN